MKIWNGILSIVLFLIVSPVQSGMIHRASVANFANSQLNPNFLGSGEGLFVNVLKESQNWSFGDNNGQPNPSDLDVNGYPLPGSDPIVNHSGLKTTVNGVPSQFERSGNYIAIGTGQGKIGLFDNASSASTRQACSGTGTGTACDNSSCTSFTGSISGQTLTVSVASSCSLLVGQPISNGSTFVNQFGVPTLVIGASGSANCPSCTGAGGTGTYLINWPQSIGSASFVPGIYIEISAAASTETTTGSVQWTFSIATQGVSSPLANMAVLHKNDLLIYASGQLTGVLFKQRIQQGNFAFLRDLNTAFTNVSNVTTWSTRKPTAYFSYGAPELRNSLYAGVTTYALNGSSNDYSVNLGAFLPVDKQTVCVKWSNTTTGATNTFSIDGGVTKIGMVNYHGSSLSTGNVVANTTDGLVFDATLNQWLTTAASSTPAFSCLTNAAPPEAFIQMNQEVGTSPWIVEPLYASDPLTDYMVQYAIYVRGLSWRNAPLFEIPDETWNCSGAGVGPWVSVKSRAYIAADATWAANTSGHAFCGASGDINNWTGKAGSLLGQAIRNVSISLPVIVGVQTVQNAASAWNANLLSNSYVGQNPSNIPIQTGCAGAASVQTSCPAPFTQTPAYKVATDITIANYWGLVDQATSTGQQAEVALAYCYFFQSGGCAVQSSVMTTYMATQSITNVGTVPAITTLWANWFNFAQTCAGGAGCTPLTVRNYEGTYSTGSISADRTSSITGAANAAVAILNVSPNGCVAGQTVGLSSLSGGTWSTAAGSYVVQSSGTDATHCAINLNSTGLGALSSATLTYTGSANYVTYLRFNSWLSADLATYTTLLYNTIASTSGACGSSSCSKFPSQFNLVSSSSGNDSNCCWLAWAPDIYGYFRVASSSLATATGGNLTLGGTVSGIFKPGVTIVGAGISGVTVTGACSQTGALPAGANAGDVCPISSSPTVGSGTAIIGSVAPAMNAAGNSTTSPVKQWGAICKWNGNTNQCDGTWLLKRDIDPASNDNDPMWLQKAA